MLCPNWLASHCSRFSVVDEITERLSDWWWSGRSPPPYGVFFTAFSRSTAPGYIPHNYTLSPGFQLPTHVNYFCQSNQFYVFCNLSSKGLLAPSPLSRGRRQTRFTAYYRSKFQNNTNYYWKKNFKLKMIPGICY